MCVCVYLGRGEGGVVNVAKEYCFATYRRTRARAHTHSNPSAHLVFKFYFYFIKYAK